MSKQKKCEVAFKRARANPDEFFKRWKYDANDRNENTVSLGAAGVEATISMSSEIRFRVRMRIGADDRKSEKLDFFRVDSHGNVTYGYEKALAAGMVMRNRWRDELAGKPTVNEEDIPKIGGKNGLIERYFAGREKGDDALLPKGNTVNWKKDKRMMELVYETILGLSCWHVTRDLIHQSHMDYLVKREEETGNRPNSSVRLTFNAAHPMFKWARDKYWMRPETLMGLKANVPKEDSRERTLTPREMQLAYPAMDALDTRKKRRVKLVTRGDVGILMRWLIATACRRSMAVDMQWGDLRTLNVGTAVQPKMLTIWCVPADKMKQNLTAMFPIVGESLRLLDVLREKAGKCERHEYVFSPAARSDWGQNANDTQKDVFAASGTKGWHRHDCRATTASMLYAAGADETMCKKLLAHRARNDKSATGGYLRFGQHLDALKALGEKLEEVHRLQKDIEEGRDTEAVRKLCNEMSTTDGVQNFLRELGMDPDEWLRIVPNPEHATAEVVPLRPPAHA